LEGGVSRDKKAEVRDYTAGVGNKKKTLSGLRQNSSFLAGMELVRREQEEKGSPFS